MDERVRLFDVVTAADLADRRLTTVEAVNAALGQPEDADSDKIERLIDQASADCAGYCRLARSRTGIAVPNFGRETVRVTWRSCHERSQKLILPWRVPIIQVTALTENGVTLAAGTDYDIESGGMLVRLCGDRPTRWSSAKIVATLKVGWELPGDVPPDLEAAVIEQVRVRYIRGGDHDALLRSWSDPELGSESYVDAGQPGGLNAFGLLTTLEGVLDQYRAP